MIELCYFSVLKTKNADLEKLKGLIEELQIKITSLEESKGWLERRLEETEVGQNFLPGG